MDMYMRLCDFEQQFVKVVSSSMIHGNWEQHFVNVVSSTNRCKLEWESAALTVTVITE